GGRPWGASGGGADPSPADATRCAPGGARRDGVGCAPREGTATGDRDHGRARLGDGRQQIVQRPPGRRNAVPSVSQGLRRERGSLESGVTDRERLSERFVENDQRGRGLGPCATEPEQPSRDTPKRAPVAGARRNLTRASTGSGARTVKRAASWPDCLLSRSAADAVSPACWPSVAFLPVRRNC